MPGANGAFLVDRASGQSELIAEPFDGSTWDVRTTPLVGAMSQDGRFALLSGSKLVPGIRGDQLHVVDREFDPQEPHSRFVFWDLTVDPRRPLSGSRCR